MMTCERRLPGIITEDTGEAGRWLVRKPQAHSPLSAIVAPMLIFHKHTRRCLLLPIQAAEKPR